MDQIVLFKIESLHARVDPIAGIKLRQKRREFFTGCITAHLDETEGPPANLGLINLTSGTIRLQWSIVATFPLTADSFAAGGGSHKDMGPVRASFDEVGSVTSDGAGFEAKGAATISPGSILSGATVALHSNSVKVVRGEPPMTRSLASGKSVRCAFDPKSFLDLDLPTSLGGGTQRLQLIGAFVLAPIMSLGGRESSKRSRR